MAIYTNKLAGIDPGLDAAREGRTVGRWANGETGYNAAATVVTTGPSGTDPGAYLNME
ncbi:MAG: hypothetical protein GWN58_34585, partial [Anaerolineae bacterium]|nr:hypothetical protein [Anaerolineae bacterium]